MMRGPGVWAASLGYLLLALAATWPLALKADTHCWGARFDLWGNLWLLWYFKEALVHGKLDFWTPLVFYPDGFSLWGYGHFFLQLVGAPLLLVVNASTAYALLLWGALVSSALALYALAYDQTQERWAAFIAGALYAFHSLKYAEMAVGSLEQVATFGLPIFALCLLRWREHGGRKWGAATFGVLILTAACNWFFGVALTVFTIVFVAFHLFRRGPAGIQMDRRLVLNSFLLAGLCLVVTAPFIRQVTPEILRRPKLSPEVLAAWNPSGWGTGGRSVSASDLVDQDTLEGITPFLSQINADQVAQTALRQTVDDALALDRILAEDLATEPRAAGPGFQIVILALIGAILGGARTRFWVAAFLVFLILSMGPFIRPAEDGMASEAVLMPYYYVYNNVPIFRVAYRPYRFMSVAVMAGGVLAAFGLAAVLGGLPARLTPFMAISLLATMAFVRWGMCSPNRAIILSDTTVPDFYHQLGDPRESFAIIEIPYHHWSFGDSNSRFQYYQTEHGKPILNNPEFINMQQLLKLRKLGREHPLVITFAEAQYARLLEIPRQVARDIAWLRAENFRYIVVHTAFPRDELHLSGYQETREMPTEVFLSFLESLFGAPKVVPGALLFDTRREGAMRAPSRIVTLNFSGDYERARVPLTLTALRPLTWNLKEEPFAGFAFWALAQPATRSLKVAVACTMPDGTRRSFTRVVSLSSEQWQRVALSSKSLGIPRGARVKSISLYGMPSGESAVSLTQLQVLLPGGG
ncbi:MAG: hypothetical protein FJX76_12930 [Armatimonadetes bacterium]|nr:hypothetical protein [Armatimonadota bacterium]